MGKKRKPKKIKIIKPKRQYNVHKLDFVELILDVTENGLLGHLILEITEKKRRTPDCLFYTNISIIDIPNTNYFDIRYAWTEDELNRTKQSIPKIVNVLNNARSDIDKKISAYILGNLTKPVNHKKYGNHINKNPESDLNKLMCICEEIKEASCASGLIYKPHPRSACWNYIKKSEKTVLKHGCYINISNVENNALREKLIQALISYNSMVDTLVNTGQVKPKMRLPDFTKFLAGGKEMAIEVESMKLSIIN